MICSSTMEFTLMRMRAVRPSSAAAVSRSMRCSSPLRRCLGATSSRWYDFSLA
jgi:hypothetical protein